VRDTFIPSLNREEGEEHTRAVQGGGGEVAAVYVEAHTDQEVKQGIQGEDTY